MKKILLAIALLFSTQAFAEESTVVVLKNASVKEVDAASTGGATSLSAAVEVVAVVNVVGRGGGKNIAITTCKNTTPNFQNDRIDAVLTAARDSGNGVNIVLRTLGTTKCIIDVQLALAK